MPIVQPAVRLPRPTMAMPLPPRPAFTPVVSDLPSFADTSVTPPVTPVNAQEASTGADKAANALNFLIPIIATIIGAAKGNTLLGAAAGTSFATGLGERRAKEEEKRTKAEEKRVAAEEKKQKATMATEEKLQVQQEKASEARIKAARLFNETGAETGDLHPDDKKLILADEEKAKQDQIDKEKRAETTREAAEVRAEGRAVEREKRAEIRQVDRERRAEEHRAQVEAGKPLSNQDITKALDDLAIEKREIEDRKYSDLGVVVPLTPEDSDRLDEITGDVKWYRTQRRAALKLPRLSTEVDPGQALKDIEDQATERGAKKAKDEKTGIPVMDSGPVYTETEKRRKGQLLRQKEQTGKQPQGRPTLAVGDTAMVQPIPGGGPVPVPGGTPAPATAGTAPGLTPEEMGEIQKAVDAYKKRGMSGAQIKQKLQAFQVPEAVITSLGF